MAADGRDLLEIGHIVKAHGLRGEVVVDLVTDRTERLAPGTELETARGTLTVVSSQPHQHRFVVRFSQIADRTTAERWRGVALRAPRLELDDVLWIDQLFGSRVETSDGVPRGTVVAVEQNPASDLMVLDNGALVPLTFVTSFTPGELVVVDVPEGLFE
jgi:16S rRNA processing protein RimM